MFVEGGEKNQLFRDIIFSTNYQEIKLCHSKSKSSNMGNSNNKNWTKILKLFSSKI